MSLSEFTNYALYSKSRNFNPTNKIYQVLAGIHMLVYHSETNYSLERGKKKKEREM